jgi:hypothetical protein
VGHKALLWTEVVLVAALLLPLAGAVVSCWRVSRCPAPLEYRENVVILTTDLLLHGKNPYILENQPVYVNVFGLGYNWVTASVMRLVGSTDQFVAHRAVSIICALACSLALFMTLRRDGVGWLLCLAGSITWLFHLCVGLAPTARPDALGLLLFLASVLVPYYAHFSARSVAASTVLGICAFLTKP